MLNKPFRAYLELNTIECEGHCTAISLTSSLTEVLKISALVVSIGATRRRSVTANLRVTTGDLMTVRDFRDSKRFHNNKIYNLKHTR